jgi:hypothetical protein
MAAAAAATTPARTNFFEEREFVDMRSWHFLS